MGWPVQAADKIGASQACMDLSHLCPHPVHLLNPPSFHQQLLPSPATPALRAFHKILTLLPQVGSAAASSASCKLSIAGLLKASLVQQPQTRGIPLHFLAQLEQACSPELGPQHSVLFLPQNPALYRWQEVKKRFGPSLTLHGYHGECR